MKYDKNKKLIEVPQAKILECVRNIASNLADERLNQRITIDKLANAVGMNICTLGLKSVPPLTNRDRSHTYYLREFLNVCYALRIDPCKELEKVLKDKGIYKDFIDNK